MIAVDADPLLLGLARAAHAGLPNLRLVLQDLREAGWVDVLDLPRRPDAIVSTTALHWLPQLAQVYRACGNTGMTGVLVALHACGAATPNR